MTRINVGVRPQELSDLHLRAEHRELKRIPNQISKGRYNMKDQPSEFTLGKGHVKFFYDKCGYLLKRYCQLYAECRRRGFDITNFIDAWLGVPDDMMGHYEVTDEARELIVQRIKERTKP